MSALRPCNSLSRLRSLLTRALDACDRVGMSDQTPAATSGRPPIHVVTRDEFEAVADVIMPVVYPVTIAMALCVALVNLLHTPGVESAGTGGMTTAVYAEKASDSASVKLEGAMANAAVFIAFITAATFALFLLFKYRLAKVIWAYMGFSGLLIFGLLGGNILLQVLDKLEIAVDMISEFLRRWGVDDVFLAGTAGGQTRVFNIHFDNRVVLLYADSGVDDVDVARGDGVV
jgi:hypothetical protein